MADIGIAIGLPFGRPSVHPLWAANFYIMDFPLNTAKSLLMVQNRPIDEARNIIVDMAMEHKAKYLFFLDDDVLPPKYAVLALGSILENKKDDGAMVATGIYCTKTFAPSPVIFKKDTPGGFLGWNINDQFEVDQCGAGCMLVNMEVFQHLKKPYFRFTQKYEDMGDESILRMVSEDVYFCNQVKDAGFKIWAHGAVLCQHYDSQTGKFVELPKESPPYAKELKRQQEEIKQNEQNEQKETQEV